MNPFSRLGELIQDWRFLILQNGIIDALPGIGAEISQLPYRHLRFLILAHPLNDILPDIQSISTLEILAFDEADIEKVKVINRPSEARLCARRLKRGHIGLVAKNQGQLAGYAWSCTEIDPQLERVHIDLNTEDFLCTDAFTAPEFRGQGVQTALALARLHKLRDMGYMRAICYIEINNKPSLAVWQRKIKSKVIGRVDFIRIGPWYRVRSSYE